MNSIDKELIISRIISGCFICNIQDNLDKQVCLMLKTPSRIQRYMAENVFKEALYKAELDGSYTEKEYKSFLYEKNLWSDDKQKVLDGLTKDIDELKLGLFQSVFKSQQKQHIRLSLDKARAEQKKLMYALHEYDYLSALGVANMTKARYLIAASLYRLDGSKLFNDNELWAASDFVIEAVAASASDDKLTEAQLREIARTDPWRTIWVSRKCEASVFGLPAVDLSEEQRLLSVWSGVYDNIYEHPDCPGEEVMTEDDALDGWMIAQKRKRDAEREGHAAEEMVGNDKIKNAEEVYIPADTVEDARKIANLNDANAAAIKSKREALIMQKGVVDEKQMPDSQLKIRAEFNRLYMEQARSKG